MHAIQDEESSNDFSPEKPRDTGSENGEKPESTLMRPRISKWWQKLLYFLAWVGISLVVIVIHPPGYIANFGIFIDAVFFLVGVRIFRGASEDVEGPQKYWRVSGGWRSSIAIVIALTLLLISTIGDFSRYSALSPGWLGVLELCLESMFGIVVYLICAIRLMGDSRRNREAP